MTSVTSLEREEVVASSFVESLYPKDATRERKFLRPHLNDPIVCSVLERIKSRADEGMRKYGVSMARGDVDTIQWLRHAQEEALDLAVYLERVIDDLEKKTAPPPTTYFGA